MTPLPHHPVQNLGRTAVIAAVAILFTIPLPGVAAAPGTHSHRQPSADATDPTPSGTSIADARLRWPGWDKVVDTLLMRKYNTRIVLLGTMLLGIGAGTVGTFMLLRKRSLIGDVVSHASLPGIAIAFLYVEIAHPGSGRSLPSLLIGALIAGLIGVLCTLAISRFSRIKEDAALAIVLSVFFGLGIALFTIVQKLPTGQIAGLQQFIYGQTASMTANDVRLIGVASVVVLLVCGTLFKEFALLCFDEQFGRSQGWPTSRLDLALMGLVVCVAIIGLQSVGLLLVVAMLIIPAAAARFWTERLGAMTIIAAGIGGLSAWIGGAISSLFARFSAGAVIVLAGATFFLISLTLGSRRGLIPQLIDHLATSHRVGRHDLMRCIYELLESRAVRESNADTPTVPTTTDPLCDLSVSVDELLAARSWSLTRLQRLMRRSHHAGLLHTMSGKWHLTDDGARFARMVARNHRLWETFLILHADIAPSHVDRDADLIEHILEADLVEELQHAVQARYPQMGMPPSPHPLS